jgi:hypothetical protein
MLYPEKGEPIAIEIDENGSFSAKEVPVGVMTVAIDAEGVHVKYSSPKTSALVVDVREGDNQFQFKLAD